MKENCETTRPGVYPVNILEKKTSSFFLLSIINSTFPLTPRFQCYYMVMVLFDCFAVRNGHQGDAVLFGQGIQTTDPIRGYRRRCFIQQDKARRWGTAAVFASGNHIVQHAGPHDTLLLTTRQRR